MKNIINYLTLKVSLTLSQLHRLHESVSLLKRKANVEIGSEKVSLQIVHRQARRHAETKCGLKNKNPCGVGLFFVSRKI